MRAQSNGEETAGIVLRIPLENLTLFPDSTGKHGLFTAFVVAKDEHGRRTPIRRATIPVSIASFGEDQGATQDFLGLPVRSRDEAQPG